MCVVGRDVSKQPPWSIATSTITEPGFIMPSISRVIRRGALAPGISTPPITRSASGSASSIACRDDIVSSTVRPRLTSSSRIRSTLRSKIVTLACMPWAISAAL